MMYISSTCSRNCPTACSPYVVPASSSTTWLQIFPALPMKLLYMATVCACDSRAYRLTTPIGISVPSTVATVFSPSIDLLPHPESIPIAITPLNATTVVFFTIFFILITNYPFTDVPISRHVRHAHFPNADTLIRV